MPVRGVKADYERRGEVGRETARIPPRDLIGAFAVQLSRARILQLLL